MEKRSRGGDAEVTRKSDGLATIRFHVPRDAIFSKTERTERTRDSTDLREPRDNN